MFGYSSMLRARRDARWDGTRHSGLRPHVDRWRFSSFAFENLMTLNAAIHCTLVVRDTVVVSLS